VGVGIGCGGSERSVVVVVAVVVTPALRGIQGGFVSKILFGDRYYIIHYNLFAIFWAKCLVPGLIR
jgi:hypothetical protein